MLIRHTLCATPNSHLGLTHIDAVQPLAQAYGVTAMPTFVVVLGGEKVDSLVGASKDKLEAMLVKHLRHQ